jgi:hypothetical protein
VEASRLGPSPVGPPLGSMHELMNVREMSARIAFEVRDSGMELPPEI